MRFVVDMNLSPLWTTLLNDNGHDAVHWRETGPVNAPDDAIIAWAAREGRIVFTADLDFATILATQRLEAPSVVQLRMNNIDPAEAGDVVLQAIEVTGAALDGGAILTIDEANARLRAGPGRFLTADES